MMYRTLIAAALFLGAVSAAASEPEFHGFESDRPVPLSDAVRVGDLLFLSGKLGIIPGGGATARLPRIVGRGWGMEMLLMGEPIDAERALQIGLITEVVSTYFELLDYHERLRISQRTLASRTESLDIIQKRLDHGIVPEIDLNQAQIQKEIAAASITDNSRRRTSR